MEEGRRNSAYGEKRKTMSSLILVDNDFPLNNKVSSLYNIVSLEILTLK